MWMRRIHSLSGNALCARHTRRGASAPSRKNQLTFPYSPSVPNILRGPTSPHITDASKNTLSIGQVHGLSGGNKEVSQRLGISSISHHAVMVYTKTATIVPTTCKCDSLDINRYRFTFDPLRENCDFQDCRQRTDLCCEHRPRRNLHVMAEFEVRNKG
ncbi:uncharacterized protein LOC120140495 [Hibiscus syriacus]|uniref:uncharacterized protein LOC120140495 n=1 Tax=Hibiscus syriacus TaxID=106335 RepID=UPI00192218AA|nr:uncharacterized protein LOC120140495 [Hibiscus syriacus]